MEYIGVRDSLFRRHVYDAAFAERIHIRDPRLYPSDRFDNPKGIAMQHAYEIDNRPFARVIFAAMLSLAMWLALIPNPVTAAPKLRDYATLEFPPCGGILFNIAIESMGDDRITESRCTFEMNEGEPTFKFEGNAICGQNSQVAFSGEAGLEPITVFHAHVTCSPDRDLVSVFDSRNCTDGMTYVEIGRAHV